MAELTPSEKYKRTWDFKKDKDLIEKRIKEAKTLKEVDIIYTDGMKKINLYLKLMGFDETEAKKRRETYKTSILRSIEHRIYILKNEFDKTTDSIDEEFKKYHAVIEKLEQEIKNTNVKLDWGKKTDLKRLQDKVKKELKQLKDIEDKRKSVIVVDKKTGDVDVNKLIELDEKLSQHQEASANITDRELKTKIGIKLGIDVTGKSTGDINKMIDRFLKDQRKEEGKQSFQQILSKSGGIFGINKALGSWGEQLGTRMRKFTSRKMGRGEVLPIHETMIDTYTEKYKEELETQGLDEASLERELLDFESRMRTNTSKSIASNKGILTEKSWTDIYDQSQNKKTAKTAPAKKYGGDINPNEATIVGENGIEIVKNNKVFTPEGNKSNSSDWMNALQRMFGVGKDSKKDPMLIHTLAMRKDIFDIKKIITDIFKYNTERDEDLDLQRKEKGEKGTGKTVEKTSSDNSLLLDKLNDIKGSQNNSIVDDLLIYKALEPLMKKFLPPLTAIAGSIATVGTAVGILGGTVYSIYDVIRDAFNLFGNDEPVDYSKFSEEQLYLVDQAKAQLDEAAKEYEATDTTWDMSGGEGAAIKYTDANADMQEIIRTGVDSKGKLKKPTKSKEQWKREREANSAKTPPPVQVPSVGSTVKDAIVHGDKVTPYDKDDLVVIGTNLPGNKDSSNKSLIKSLKEAFKELKTETSYIDPNEIKKTVLELYVATVSVWEKNTAIKKNEKSQQQVSMLNNTINNIGSNGNVKVVYVPVPYDKDFPKFA